MFTSTMEAEVTSAAVTARASLTTWARLDGRRSNVASVLHEFLEVNPAVRAITVIG